MGASDPLAGDDAAAEPCGFAVRWVSAPEGSRQELAVGSWPVFLIAEVSLTILK